MAPDVDGIVPNANVGLTGVEAARRLAVYGPNEPAPDPPPLGRRSTAPPVRQSPRHHPARRERDRRLAGTAVDALIIVTMVVLGVAINFWQSYRSQQAAERLRRR